MEEIGCRETDGDKEMQNERGMPRGEQTQRLKEWKAAELTDTAESKKRRSAR